MKRKKIQRGTIMIETVFLLPILLMLISMLMYSGYQMVNIHRTIKMARYETWRNVHDSPGPSSDPYASVANHDELDNTFFMGFSPTIEWAPRGGDAFPQDVYEDTVDASRGTISGEAADLHEAWLYLDGDDRRIVAGWREGFEIFQEDMPFNFWNQFTSPIARAHQRIHQYWSFTDDPLASADTWEGRPTPLYGGGETEAWRSDTEQASSGIIVHHKRAVRDVFLDDLDSELDSIDGDNGLEYGNSSVERPNRDTMTGFIRSLYLNQPRYRGPIVTDEN